MPGFTQTVRCIRHYPSGDTSIAWEMKLYYPAADYNEFMQRFDAKPRPTDVTNMQAMYGYSYVVMFDQTAVRKKPRAVARWTD